MEKQNKTINLISQFKDIVAEVKNASPSSENKNCNCPTNGPQWEEHQVAKFESILKDYCESNSSESPNTNTDATVDVEQKFKSDDLQQTIPQISNDSSSNDENLIAVSRANLTNGFDGEIMGHQYHPLLNDVIMRLIFEYMSVKTLKDCRLVCTKWSQNSVPLLKKQCRLQIRFVRYNYYDSTSLEEILEKLKSYFKGPLPDMPFQALGFAEYIPVITNPIFVDIINEVGIDTIKDLKLDNIEMYSYNVKYNISSLIGTNVTKLHLSCNEREKLSLVVDLSCLKSIESLYLGWCLINIENDVKISPKELTLEYVTLKKNGGMVAEIQINDILDFSRLKNLKVLCDSHSSTARPTRFGLNLQDSVSVDKLQLCRGVNILSWQQSNWTVNTLHIGLQPNYGNFPNMLYPRIENKMGVNDLIIECSYIDNISWFPDTITRLSFLTTRLEDMVAGPAIPTCLSKLKYLHMKSFENNHLEFLERFHDSLQNVVDVHLILHGHFHDSRFNIDLLPPNTKRLRLYGVTSFGLGESVRNLDTLILEEYSWENVDAILRKLKPKHLVIKNYLLMGNSFRKVMQILPLFQSLAIGRLLWDNSEHFESSSLARIVDRRATYYLFQNNKGKSIIKKQFEKMIEM